MPGSKQAWPMVAACWSPATPRMGISAPNRLFSVTPKSAAQSSTSGSMAFGTRRMSSSSSSQAFVAMLYISVRLALVASVTWDFPPVSRQMRKVSMVPKQRSPFAPRARAPFTLESIHESLVPEK